VDLLRDAILLNNQPLNASLIQNIVGRKQFKAVIFENRLGVKGNLNGANLNELIESTLHRSGNENVEGTKHFRGGRLLFNQLDVITCNNERNRVSALLDYRDLDKASFTFSQPIEILGDLVVTSRVNNVSLSALYQDSLRLRLPQTIPGKLKFNELTVTKDAK